MESLKWRIKNKYKKVVLLSITFCFFVVGNGQTFSKRANHSLPNVYQHVVIETYGYQTIGRGFDSLVGNLELPFVIKGYNFAGDELYTKQYYFENSELNPNNDCNARLNDSTVLFIGIELTTYTDTIYNTLVWLNNEGDTLKTKQFHSPYHIGGIASSSHFVPTALTTSDDGQFIYFVSQIVDYPPIQNNFLIKKLSSQGDEVWTYINPISLWYYSCSAIVFFEDQLWFVVQASGEQGNYNKLQRLNDTSGVVDYSIEHNANDFILGGAAELFLDIEGYTVTTVGGSVNNIVPYTLKVDYAGNYLWYEKPSDEYAQLQYADHLAQAQDGGYVSCSIKYEEIPSVTNPSDPSDNNTNSLIWLWKVDANGVLQWERNYEYLSFDSLNYYHIKSIAHDFKATPDGGFIAAGEASANCSDYPICDHFTQQGWLLKVDGCGCLVPGCDINCTVGIDDSGRHPELVSGSLFLVGPNPARDMLNVYLNKISNVQLSTLNIQVHDLQGKLVGSFALKHADTTYMIDTTSLAAGQYVLSLVSEGIVLQTEQIIIAK